MIAFMGFDLLRPDLALAFALLPLVLVAGIFEGLARKRARAALADPALVGRTLIERSRVKSRARLVCELLGLFFVVLALLGPTRGFTRRPVERSALDLVVCVDTSRSMLASDVHPSRLDRARREVGGLFARLAGDRVGMLAFSGDVREVAPLTADTRTLTELLSEVNPDENRVGGTNLGLALERALQIFDGRTGAHEAIVVLTDGEDLEGRAADVAKRAGDAGIRIFVVGIGTPEGGKIPIADASGGERFLVGPDGQEVVTRLDRESLGRIANLSGGAFLTTSDSANPLEEIYTKRIARLAGRRGVGGEERVPNDRFQWALIPGIALLLIGYGLGERRFGVRKLRPLGLLLASGALLLASDSAQAAAQAPGGAGPLDPTQAPDVAAVLEEAKAAAVAREAELATMDLRAILDRALGELEGADAMAAYLTLNTALGEPDPFAELDAAATSQAPDAAEPEPEPRWSDVEAAHLWFARAIAAEGLGLGEAAIEDFEFAAGLTELPALRRFALANAGALALVRAEARRAELQQPAVPDAGGAEDQDPIEEQRELYFDARTRLLAAWRADPANADVRANLELCVRRLRELDAEEEQQEQQDQQSDEGDESEESEESDNSEESEESEEESQDEPEGSEPDEPQEPEDTGEQEPEGEPETSDEQLDQEPEVTEESLEEPELEPQPLEDVGELSDEEFARLLDRLQELEQARAELRRRLTKSRREPTDRDW